MTEKLIPFQVNVVRQADDWILIHAKTQEAAEEEASKRPGVIRVVKGHTVRADKAVGVERQGGEDVDY